MTPPAVSKALMRWRFDDRSELIWKQIMKFESEEIT